MVIIMLVEFAIELQISMLGQARDRGWGLTRSKTDTSIMLWLKYAVRFFTTLTATTS